MTTRERLGQALADALRRTGAAAPDAVNVEPGRSAGRGEWTCAWCRRSPEAQELALRAAMALDLAGCGIARAEAADGFLNLYLSDGWYRERTRQLARTHIRAFAAPEGSSDERYLALRGRGRPLTPDWPLRRDRENPLYAIRYAARRAAVLAARTDGAGECLTEAGRALVRALDACADAPDARGLLVALERSAEAFRVVYEEQKPGFRAGMAAAAAANVLREGLRALGLEEDPKEEL